MPMTQQNQKTDELIARQLLAQALASAFSDPHHRRGASPWCGQDRQLVSWAWRELRVATDDVAKGEMGLGELPPSEVDIDALVNWLELPVAMRSAVFQRVFGLVVSKLCPPYETEYSHWKDATYRAHQLADIAGFYRAFALQPNPDEPERQDHVALELEFIAFVLRKLAIHSGETASQAEDDQAELCRDALGSFMKDHAVWWMPTFAKCVERRIEQLAVPSLASEHCGHLLLFGGVARVLRAWVATERLANGVEASRQIIAPQVETPEPTLEMCGSCSSECEPT